MAMAPGSFPTLPGLCLSFLTCEMRAQQGPSQGRCEDLTCFVCKALEMVPGFY